MMLSSHIHILGLHAWAVAAILAGAWAAVVLGPHVVGRRDRGGDPARGHAIWVEPLRCPGWFWGLYTIPRALRAAGFGGTFEYFTWQTWWQGLLILPVLTGRLADRAAERLAESIAKRRVQHPHAPVYVIGYSSGTTVALRALELLPAGVTVRSLALCQGATAPRRDLSGAMAHVAGRTVVTSSALDFVVLGLGTMVFAGSDGLRGPSMGLMGARHAGLAGLPDEKFRQIRWRPRMIGQGLFGGHLWATARRFVAGTLCPAMGIGLDG